MGRCWLPAVLWAVLGAAADPEPTLLLRNGVRMPAVGYGSAGRMGRAQISAALEAGYRLLDTAQAPEWYDEPAAGRAVAGRSVWVTSKLHARHHGRTSAERQLEMSLDLFRGKLDCMLLHHPVCWLPMCDPAEAEGSWLDSWAVLERAYEAGKLRAIGVCNVGVAELKQLLAVAEEPPHIVQNWMDPLHQDQAVRSLCAERGIQYQAYSTLGTQHGSPNPILSHPTLERIAAGLGRSVAQVVLRWALQLGVAVIPRSTRPGHMRSNLELWSWQLSPDQMHAINRLSRPAPRLPVVLQAGQRLSVEWVGPEGAVTVGEVELGKPLKLESYEGHKFVGREAGGAAVMEWIVASGGAVETRSLTPHPEL